MTSTILPTIPFWSFTSAQNFDKCPKILEHRYILKTPADDRDTTAATRGTAIHKNIEDFLQGKKKPNQRPTEAGNTHVVALIDPQQFSYEGLVGEVKALCETHPFSIEEKMYFDRDWQPVTSFNQAWLLLAMDVFIRVSETECIIVDWKTGKRDGNEIKHMHQGQLYALAASKKYPKLEKFTVIFVYLDLGVKTTNTWKTAHLNRIFPTWNEKGLKITSTTIFRAIPNKWSCKYCDYANSCPFSIKDGDI